MAITPREGFTGAPSGVWLLVSRPWQALKEPSRTQLRGAAATRGGLRGGFLHQGRMWGTGIALGHGFRVERLSPGCVTQVNRAPALAEHVVMLISILFSQTPACFPRLFPPCFITRDCQIDDNSAGLYMMHLFFQGYWTSKTVRMLNESAGSVIYCGSYTVLFRRSHVNIPAEPLRPG